MTTSYLDDAPLRYALQPFASRLQGQHWSPDQFMALLVAFAAGSWKPPEPGPVGVDADAVASKLAGDKAPAFLQLCLDCGVLVRNDGRTWRFRDAWLHGNLAARYLAQFLDGEYSERGLVRDRAVDALARIGSPAIPVLVAAFAHQDDMTGLGAAATFWSLGPQSVPAVLDALSVGNDRVRRWAISALGSKDNANAALPALIRVMEQDQQPLVVAEAVTALRSSENPDAEPALIAALRHDHPMVRMLAKGALEAFDSPRARRALEEVAPPVPARASVSERSHDSGLTIQSEYQNASRPQTPGSSAPRVFISYARENASDAHEIRRLLQLAEFDPWMDSSELLAGEQWETRLAGALRTSDFVVALISEYSAGGYQDIELRAAADNVPKGRPADIPFIVPCLTGRFEAVIPAFLDARDPVKIMDGSWRILHERLCAAARSAGLGVPELLRSTPRGDLTAAAATEMIVHRKFFSSSRNASGRPASDRLVSFMDGIVTDRVTGRQWRQATEGSSPLVGQDSVVTMIAEANRKQLGGANDWRLPTLDEAMSLMARERNARRNFMSELFTDESYALTCDTCPIDAQTFVWIVSYMHGDCQTVPASSSVPVRLVRTAWEHLK